MFEGSDGAPSGFCKAMKSMGGIGEGIHLKLECEVVSLNFRWRRQTTLSGTPRWPSPSCRILINLCRTGGLLGGGHAALKGNNLPLTWDFKLR